MSAEQGRVGDPMRRLNVKLAQIEECIRTSLFAVDALPRQHPLQRGEVLLLQLVLEDARRIGKVDSRIDFALKFDRVKRDRDGARSLGHWPEAGKAWRYILDCAETLPTIPFSLENLGLSREYGGQANAVYIEPEDAAKIRPFIKGGGTPEHMREVASVPRLVAGLRNYDRIVREALPRTTDVEAHTRRLGDPWLADTLKNVYDHRCQICRHDFKPRYGVPYADTRFLVPFDRGGQPVSRNLLVICPNHDSIIGAARAEYDDRALAFRFPNGFVEKIDLRDHLLN